MTDTDRFSVVRTAEESLDVLFLLININEIYKSLAAFTNLIEEIDYKTHIDIKIETIHNLMESIY